jgi:HAD superfamily hydrolase (TIGR01509 family)
VRIDVEVLGRLGWPLTEEEVVERFLGVSDEDFRGAVEARLGPTLPRDWEEQFTTLYRNAFEAELRPVEGIVDALDAILLPTCVASSGSHEKMRFTLGLAGLYDRFAGRIFSATDVRRGKPAPDLFLHAAERMGIDPGACVVVADSHAGVLAARSAGMRVLGYAGGLTPTHRLEAAGAVVFSDMRRLPELLEELRPAPGG